MKDITAPKQPVEIDIRFDGKVVWVNVDGRCELRICEVSAIVLKDSRNAKEIAANKRRLKAISEQEHPSCP